MSPVEIILGIVILVLSVILVACVLMQSGKDKRLSGSIAGGAETFFGKSKGKTIDRILSKWTSVISIAFLITAIILSLVLK